MTSAGWNTSNPWQTPDTNALMSGLTQAAQPTQTPAPTAAVADPTDTPTTPNPTSAARMLGTALPQESAQPQGGALAQSLMQGLSSLGQNKAYTVSQGTPLSVAPNSTSNVAPGNTAKAPPQNVAVPSSSGGGWYVYYTYDASIGGYRYAGQYNPAGQKGYGAGGVSTPFAPPTDVQYSGQALVNTPGMTQDNGGLGATQVNQQYSQAIDTYKAGATQATANQTAAAQAANVASALAYMNAHGGAMDPNVVLPASSVTAAQEAYKAQQATQGPAFTFNGGQGPLPIDTTAADITGVNAKNAIASQYATNVGGADAAAIGRAGAFAQANQTGENKLLHDTAAANSFNTNLAAFGNALQAQATADTNATGTKLQNDIQAVGDVAARLESQVGQLDATTQVEVRGRINQLNQQIAYYNQQVAQYGADVQFVMNIAKGILAAGAGVAAIATGGVAGVAIGAAATAAGSAIR